MTLLPLLTLEHTLVSTGASRGPNGLILHSDRGAQYVSLVCSDALTETGMTASMRSL